MKNILDVELSRRDFAKGLGLSAAFLLLPGKANAKTRAISSEEHYKISRENMRRLMSSYRRDSLDKLVNATGRYHDESLRGEVVGMAVKMLTTNYTIPYKEKRSSLSETFSRISRFRDYIEQNSYLTMNNIQLEIKNLATSLIAQESGGDITATSNPEYDPDFRARGLTQLMKETARGLGLRVDKLVDYRLDPESSIMCGLKYLKEQILENPGDIRLNLIAYNAGPKTARRIISRKINGKEWTALKRHLPDEKQTGEFVEKILAMRAILDAGMVKFPQRQFYSSVIGNNSVTYFEPRDINLHDISRNGIEIGKLKKVNPHLLQYKVPRLEKLIIPDKDFDVGLID